MHCGKFTATCEMIGNHTREEILIPLMILVLINYTESMDILKQGIIGLIAVLPLGAIFMMLLKSVMATNDRRHNTSKSDHATLLKKLHEIDLKLARMDGESFKSDFQAMQKDVYSHGAQLKAAFKILDHKRVSDCDG